MTTIVNVVTTDSAGENKGLPAPKSLSDVLGLSEARATETAYGTVQQAAHQPDAAGANPTKAEYDALLAALEAAGIMASS